MRELLSARMRIIGLAFVLIAALVATWGHAAPEAVNDNGDNPDAAADDAQQLLFEKFAATLTQATLVGNFTESGKEEKKLNEERYEIASVEHVKGELWLFKSADQVWRERRHTATDSAGPLGGRYPSDLRRQHGFPRPGHL